MNKALYPLLGGIMALGLVGAAPGAQATILTYTFGDEFSSEVEQTLSGQVVVTIDDHDDSGSVDVTIDTDGLDDSFSEKVTGLYLNLNPEVDPADLTESYSGDDPLVTSVGLETDEFKADGDGLYDILIEWTTSDPGIFGADQTDLITFTLFGLTADDFDFSSTDAGGHGPFQAVLRVISLGDGTGSGFFSPIDGGFDPGDETLVPEPGTLALFGFGLAGLALAVRRRRKVS